MKCKKCGNKISFNYYSCLMDGLLECYKNRKEPVPQILLDVYKEYSRVYFCEKCNEPIDFKDMPIEMFFEWLSNSSNDGDSREASGKALIRYFELDKLLEPKKDAGD